MQKVSKYFMLAIAECPFFTIFVILIQELRERATWQWLDLGATEPVEQCHGIVSLGLCGYKRKEQMWND